MMKKVTFLLASLFIALTTTQAISTENLYLVGNASPAGWSTGDAIEMTKLEDGIFEWEGVLKSKDEGNNERFKFLVERAWEHSVTCQYTVAGHTLIVDGEETPVYQHPGGNFDNAFQVAETAVYNIVVNLNMEIMVCTKLAPAPVGPDLTQLYIAGGATNANGDWSNENPITMTKMAEGVFEWFGNLYTNPLAAEESKPDVNLFKFLNTKGSWVNSINPDADYDLTTETDYALIYKPGDGGDHKFKVTEDGVYTISADLNTLVTRFTKGAPGPDLTQLYIVGNATTAGWSPENALEMTKTADGVFTWTGSLSTDNGGNQFKFLNKQGSWSQTVVAKDADNTPFVVGVEYDLNYRRYESSPNDYKFIVTNNGNYVVTVNLNTMKMSIANDTGIKDAKILPFGVEVIDGTINVTAEEVSKIQSVNLFDLSGKSLSVNNLAKGVYILKVIYAGEEYTKKVIVK